MKLIGVDSDARTIKVRAAAKLSGVELSYEGIKGSGLKKGSSPTNKLPVLYRGDDLVAFSSNAIVGLVASKELQGEGFAACEIQQWLEYSANSVEHLAEIACGSVPGVPKEHAEGITKAALTSLIGELEQTLEKDLGSKTFLVGDRLSMADIGLTCALLGVFGDVIDPKTRTSKFVNISRWLETCVKQAGLDEFLETPFSFNSGNKKNKKKGGAGPAKAGKPDVIAAAAPVAPSAEGYKPNVKMLWSRSRVRVMELLHSPQKGAEFIGKTVVVSGWQRTLREQAKKTLAFVELNDGSCYEGLQIVANVDSTEGFEDLLASGGTGACVEFTGTIVASPAKGQVVEMQAVSVRVLGNIDADAYPLKKTGKGQKGHSVEFLREIAHLRPRTHLIGAVARVRNACAQALHQFFRERGFLYVHTPIITASDCEGAGEMFAVSTIITEAAEKHKGQLPLVKDAKEAAQTGLGVGSVNWKSDFFGKPSFLTVSGQLNVETYACALSDCYTFGPTFRAENSHTTRHLAEFWMCEPEMCFCTLQDDMNLAEDFLKYLTQYVLDHCPSDIQFFEQRVEKGLVNRLRNVIDNPFIRLTYTQAIDLLNQPEHLEAGKFQEHPSWGIDLGSEHERYITEKIYGQPVILTDYPADIKAFYMRQNPLDDKGRLTVQAMDILVPQIGEIIGGSAREERLELLEKRIKDMGLKPEDFSWYCDLRRYGTVPHAGFGLGFERLVLFVTGVTNIRDVIPFPRYPGHCDF